MAGAVVLKDWCPLPSCASIVNENLLYTVPSALMSDDDADGAMAVLSTLVDPVRRRLYRFVGAQDHAVGRDEAAQGVGVSRSTAAFHLDRLVEKGLLEAEFRRLTGRQGPGAGRPAKLYRRSPQEISLSLPARRYELAAGLLAAAVTETAGGGGPVEAVLDGLARRRGADMAAPLAPLTGSLAQAVSDALGAEGYEARTADGDVILSNCPFSGLVADHSELMCRVNLALLEGFSEALPQGGVTARVQPNAGACCVRLEVRAS